MFERFFRQKKKEEERVTVEEFNEPNLTVEEQEKHEKTTARSKIISDNQDKERVEIKTPETTERDEDLEKVA